MNATIRYEVADGIATLTLDRPAAKNALGPEEWQGVTACVEQAAADQAVRVLVVTGAGGTFSAGGDLKTMPARLALPHPERKAGLRQAAEVILRLRQLPKPVIAAIDGAAMGAGLSLALACDVRIASTRARFGAAFHRIGLTGDFGLLWLLPRVVGPTRAMDLLLSADPIDADAAAQMGLLTRVIEAERLSDEVYSYARRMVAGPPVAQGLTKLGLHHALQSDLAAMLDWEAEAQATCSQTEDAREGVRAFLERRPPRFQGR